MVDLSRLTEEEKLFCARVEDMIARCEKKYTPQFTHFLDERQALIARQVLARSGWQDHLFYGGYPDAERTLLGVFPPYTDPDEAAFPLQPVTVTFRGADNLSHRDFLGALMGLQLKRETVGDILVEQGRAVIFFTKTVAPLVLSELTKVGSAGVKLSDAPLTELPAPREMQSISGTVSSMRLDCVASLVTKLSREKAAQLIRAGLVQLDFVTCQQVDRTVKEGDRLSIRGYGKYIVGGDDGLSKKGRIRLTVQKYT